jgi:hypothetical protein
MRPMGDDELAALLENDLPEPRSLPPDLVYWRAEILARRERQERALAPLGWAARLSWIGAAAAFGLTLALRFVR